MDYDRGDVSAVYRTSSSSVVRDVLVGFAVLSVACATPASVAVRPSASKPVYVVSHGWHVALAVRRADVSPSIWPERNDQGALRYLEVGWGDGDYYPAAQGTMGLALRAAFRSRSSVLYVAAFDAPGQRYSPAQDIVEVRLSSGGFDALCRFIHGSYALDSSGRPVMAAPGMEPHSAFYEATGRYHVFSNSNHWVARALAEAGCSIVPGFAVNAGNVVAQALRLGRAIGIGARDWPEDPAAGARGPDC